MKQISAYYFNSFGQSIYMSYFLELNLLYRLFWIIIEYTMYFLYFFDIYITELKLPILSINFLLIHII